jgi:hypothetical protein
MGFYLPDSIWPYAFLVLVAFITTIIIILHKLYERLGKTNILLSSTMASLDEAKAKADLLQTSIDNIIKGRDELCDCLNAAANDEEKLACIRRIAMGTQGDGE